MAVPPPGILSSRIGMRKASHDTRPGEEHHHKLFKTLDESPDSCPQSKTRAMDPKQSLMNTD